MLSRSISEANIICPFNKNSKTVIKNLLSYLNLLKKILKKQII